MYLREMAVVTDFMQGLSAEMVEKHGISETTARKYIADLYKLNGGAPFKSLTFLKDEAAIKGRLEPYAESTRVTMLSAAVTALKGKRAYKRAHDMWAQELYGRREALDEAEDKRGGKKTEREADNWLDWAKVLETREGLAKEVADLPATGALTSKQWDTLQKYLILCLYTMIPPRRNLDYLEMVTAPKGKVEDTSVNYWVPKRRVFIFNRYKTAKTHGAQELEVPEELAEVLERYMRHHPLAKGARGNVRLLVKADGTPVTSGNAITRVLNRVFGRKVGSNLLRHSYLSSKYDLEKMQEDAEAMGHTLEEQKGYLRK